MKLLLLLSLLGAGAFDQTFDAGVSAYEQENFPAAIVSFETLIDQEVRTPDVFYNLGNSYFRMGHLGGAIANYERALQLDPGHEDAEENLFRCLQMSPRGLPKPASSDFEQAFLFWHGGLSPGTSFSLAVLFWILAWTALSLRQIRAWPYLRIAAGICMVLTVLFTASWQVKNNPPLLAVTQVDLLPVHYGMDTSEKVRFELYEGDRVEVDDRIGDWVRVNTVDGERGWAEASGLIFVGSPASGYRDFAVGER